MAYMCLYICCIYFQVRKDPHKLKCRYFNNNNHPNLVIQPVKMEDVIKKPWLVLFHNVVSDYEIAKIKEIATPRVSSRLIIMNIVID